MPEHDHDCRIFLEQLSDIIDGTLDAECCRHFNEHLENCEHCRVVVDTTRKTIDLYHKSNEVIELPEGVRSRLFHCLDLDQYLEHDQPE